jgi:hypothetical protein
VLQEPAQLVGMEGLLPAGGGPELPDLAQKGKAIGAGLGEPQRLAGVHLQVAPCCGNQALGAR